MKFTNNYNLNLPDLSDQYNLEHWNANTSKIDEQLKIDEDNLNLHKLDLGNPHQVKGSQLTEPVPTDKIQDGAVTTDKIADNSVTTDKIANESTTFDKLSKELQDILLPAGKVEYLSFIPDENWLKTNKRLICDGSPISRTEYPRLFSALGVTYGVGDGTTTFNLPNYIGKMLFGSKTTVTETGGSQNVTLTENELPAHTHSMTHEHTGTTTDPVCLNQSGGYSCKLDAGFSINSKTVGLKINSYSGNTGTTGSGNAFSVMNPYNTAVPVITY